jgi:hypothetical protein
MVDESLIRRAGGDSVKRIGRPQSTLNPLISARNSLIVRTRFLSRSDRASSVVGNRNSVPWKTERPLQLAQTEMSPSCGLLFELFGSTNVFTVCWQNGHRRATTARSFILFLFAALAPSARPLCERFAYSMHSSSAMF